MKISQQGIDLLIAREALRTEAYLDSVGVPTIGVGHTGPEVHMGLVWTEEHCKEVFAQDLERFENALNDNLKVDLQQNQFDALVSWLFNVGTDWARKSTLMRLVNEGSMSAAALEFDKWHIPPEVTSRRNGEREQFKGTALEPRI